jgi:hypothetical protein
MRALVAGLLVIVGLLGWRLLAEIEIDRGRAADIRDLRLKLEERSRLDALELQAKCAEQAAKLYHSSGYKDDEPLTRYESHFNLALNKCFIVVEHTAGMKGQGALLVETRYLFDAYEQREYAEFTRATGARSWVVCKLIPTAGAEKSCTTVEEFKAFVAGYME